MGTYDSDAINEMVSKVDLLEYASKTYEFKKNGNDSWVTKCPLHKEDTASMSISPSKQIYKCFGCNATGNLFTWLRKVEGLDYNDTIDKLSELSGTPIENLKACESLKYYKAVKRAITPKSKAINKNRVILDEDELNAFSDSLPQEWIDEGILPDVMREFNIRIDEDGNRIIYPVYDADFNLIGFKGRTRFKRFKEMKIMKYMNYRPIGTTDYFAGMKENVKYIEEKNEAIIFEGIKSVMKAAGWGYRQCIAAETSMLNSEQVKLLIKMHVKKVIIAFDSDVKITKIRECTKMLRKFTNVYYITGTLSLIGDKCAPVDGTKEDFEELLKEMVKI